MQYGQVRPYSPGTPIEVTSGQRLSNIDIRLAPGATVEGRVFDESGEPVADAVVMTLRAQYLAGQKRVVSVGRVLTTNEKGEFHLFGLPPGAYYVSATLINGAAAGEASSREGYAPTYYPSTLDPALAEVVVLSEGEQHGGLDITLNMVKTASIAGVVRDSEGRAFSAGTVTVTTASSGLPIPLATAAIGADGSFRVGNVPPGRLMLTAASTASSGAPTARQVASQTVTVTGEDLAGIDLTSPRLSAVGGSVHQEAGVQDALPPAGVQIRLFSTSPAEDVTDAGTLIRANADGSFNAVVRPGHIRVELSGTEQGWYLSRVLQGGRDVTDAGLSLRPDGNVEDLQVLLTKHVSIVSGSVTDNQNHSVTDYAVSIFSKDPAHWGFRSRRVAAAKADQYGRFAIRGLPAGDYLIVAVDYMEQGEASDPEFLETLRSSAQALQISTNGAQNVSLTLRKR